MRDLLPTRRLRLLALALSLPALSLPALAGCPDILGLSDRDEREEALADARARWRSQGPDDYRFEFRKLCFCHPSAVRLVKVTVQDGAVTDVEVLEEVPNHEQYQYPTPTPEQYYTVEGLFAKLEQAIDRDAHEIRVTYHPALGYPTSVFIDYDENAADEEFGWEARSLQPTS